MERNALKVALFDNDGVILDTESQYSVLWDSVGLQYHPEIPGFGNLIKGQTLSYILQTYFPGPALQKEIITRLYAFEKAMKYNYIPGFLEFVRQLRSHGVKTAVVTSSDQTKMQQVYRARPEFKSLFDRILTSEDFTASKPDPACYLLGARVFQSPLKNCVVFEDSLNGLKAGTSAGIFTVGLSTTNPREVVAPLCDYVIPDFTGFTFEMLEDLLRKRN